MRRTVLVVMLAGCYAPRPPAGAHCADGVCPSGLVCSPATQTCELTATDPADAALDTPPVLPSSFRYRRRISIHNAASAPLPTGFTIRVPLPSVLALLASQGKVNPDLSDLRVIGDDAIGERDRIIDPVLGPAPAALSFSLQAPIAAGATSTGYALYYGNPAATVPPANGAAVFPIYDDFTNGISALWLRNDAPISNNGKLVLRAGHTDALATNATTDPLPVISAIELVASVADPTSEPTTQPTGTFYYWFGYQHINDFIASDPWVVWISRDKNQIRAEQKSPVGCEAGTCNGTPATPNTAPHAYAIERDPTATRFYVDGALSYTAMITGQVDYAVMVRNFMATSDLSVDWIRARARVSPDPTITVAAEETM